MPRQNYTNYRNGGQLNVAPYYSKKKRSVDKQILSISASFTNTQAATTLYTATYPCTVMGLRINGSVQSAPDTTASPDAIGLACIVLKQGFTNPNNMALGNGNTFYSPESDVIWFKSGISDTFVNTGDGAFVASLNFEGAPKTMRKLEAGDRLLFIYNGSTADTKVLQGSVQFFLKV